VAWQEAVAEPTAAASVRARGASVAS